MNQNDSHLGSSQSTEAHSSKKGCVHALVGIFLQS